jgi:transcriptional regulator with XRE-family HTH domain
MTNQTVKSFGSRLRWWRERRGLSQLELAAAASTTQRHVSFLESGRTSPSREMVLRLAATLDVPLRQQNALLLAAGFAPAWHERDLSAPELAKVNSALDFMLAQQEPYPGFVVDRRWNVSPDGLRPFIDNWEDVALYFLRGVQADALADGTAETAQLLKRLLAFPGFPALSQVVPPGEGQAPVLAIHFRRDQTSLRLFTAIATLGTPLDVTVQEIRVEGFFPADDETAQILHEWAGRAKT